MAEPGNQALLIRLRRNDTSTPWGFRMHGGRNYGMPLYIQKITARSLSHKAGLRPGDGILQIGMTPATHLTHEQAKMEIIRAGNEVDFYVQRNVVPVETATKAPADNIVEERTKYRGDTGHSAKQTRSFRMLEAYLTETEAQEAAMAQQQAAAGQAQPPAQ